MKNIRLGNDISIKWYVYRMNSPEDFNGKTVDVYLLDKNDVKQNFSYKIEDGLIDGVFYGKNQITTGSYRLVLVENAGNNNMVTLDYVDAFVLNSKMHNTTSSGSDTVCNMKTQIVNLTSIMSSKTGATNLYDYYTREEVDEILKCYTKTVDLESYALKTELPDTSNFATKDELSSEYDDTAVRNLIDTKQDKLNDQQIANLNADHSKYLTQHQTLPDYSTTYAPLEHTHDNYVTKNELDAASYITADKVTYPDYSNTYANINHTHDQYLTEHQDLSAYALKTELFSKDYNDLTNKPTIPEEYDDTQVRNMIAGKQDKLSASQIANLNADHSKYLTQHQTLPDYSTTYAQFEHTHSEYLTSESDPTVPAYVKSIKQSDIDAWNAATGGVDLSNYVTKNELDAASYITADQVTYPDYSNTYANINHTHDQYLTEHQDLSAYVKTVELESYALKTELPDTSNFATKDEIVPAYDDTAVRNLIDTKQDKLSEQQIANLNADHSKYLTEHQTLPDYSSTYAPLEHSHSQYLESESDPTVPAYVKSIKQTDIDAWNAATGGVDLSNYALKDHTHSEYVTKTELDAASYITADKVTYPDYSNTYANINHTHNQYALKTELFSKDYNDLTNKPNIPEEYDDTQVRNLIGTKQDKLTTQQIANLDADHSKYLTQHQALPDYSNTYAGIVHTHSQYADKQHTHSEYLESESDPTVPAYVKSIKQTDIDAWNAATGGVDLSNYVTKTDLETASYITADQVTYPDYSNTYAPLEHSHNQYALSSDLASYALKTELFSKDYNDLTNKPTIPEEYDDTTVRNLIDTKQDKLTTQQIANLNADHSKYLTQHQTLPDYSTTYAPFEHTHTEYALKTEIPDTSNFATISYLNEKLGSIDAALTNILEG